METTVSEWSDLSPPNIEQEVEFPSAEKAAEFVDRVFCVFATRNYRVVSFEVDRARYNEVVRLARSLGGMLVPR